MNTTTNDKPLWKVLNEQRTQGKWIAKGSGGTSDGGSTKQHPCFNGSITAGKQDIVQQSTLIGMQGKTPIEAEANAQYTALAVNNLSPICEALENLIAYCNHIPQFEYSNELKKAKEALKRIS